MNAATENPLQASLGDVSRAGVYQLPQVAAGREALVAAAEACGYCVFHVDLAGAGDKEGLLLALGRDMAFPEWYGCNWDALADCLTDLGWRPAEGYLVLLEHVERLHARAGSELITALSIFAEAAGVWREQGVAFWCLVDLTADGIAADFK